MVKLLAYVVFCTLPVESPSCTHRPVAPDLLSQLQGWQGAGSSKDTPFGRYHPSSHRSQFMPVVCAYVM